MDDLSWLLTLDWRIIVASAAWSAASFIIAINIDSFLRDR